MYTFYTINHNFAIDKRQLFGSFFEITMNFSRFLSTFDKIRVFFLDTTALYKMLKMAFCPFTGSSYFAVAAKA